MLRIISVQKKGTCQDQAIDHFAFSGRLFQIEEIREVETDYVNPVFEGKVTFHNNRTSNILLVVNDDGKATLSFNYVDFIIEVKDTAFFSVQEATDAINVMLISFQMRDNFDEIIDKLCDDRINIHEHDSEDLSLMPKPTNPLFSVIPKDTFEEDAGPYKPTDPVNLEGKLIENVKYSILGGEMPCFIVTLRLKREEHETCRYKATLAGSIFLNGELVDDPDALDGFKGLTIVKIESGTMLLKNGDENKYNIFCSGIMCSEE